MIGHTNIQPEITTLYIYIYIENYHLIGWVQTFRTKIRNTKETIKNTGELLLKIGQLKINKNAVFSLFHSEKKILSS